MAMTMETAEAAGMDELPVETGPLRTCIVTRESHEKAAMIRFVADPEGRIVPDLKGDLPGRGYWVKADAGTLAEGLKRHVFAKVSKGKAKAAPDLVERVTALLERQLLDQLGLAKKSGHLVAGFEKVEAALRQGKVALLVEASDGAAEGRGKLARLARSGVPAGSEVEIWAPLPAEALAPAIGRFTAVHVAVKPGGMADRLALTLRRHAGFRRVDAAGAG
jgi:predicted RNA-binding protein YlxR (DUF448 family)